MLSLFRNCQHAKRNIRPHSTVLTEQEKNPVQDQFCKFAQGYRIKKINQTLELFEAAQENYENE